MSALRFFAAAPKAMAELVAGELREWGIQPLKISAAGVAFAGTLEDAYRICLWSRTASRLILTLDSFTVKSADDLYNGVRAVDWSRHFMAGGSFAVAFDARHSPAITHTHFGALKVKDAIVDQLRTEHGRPAIDTERPSLRIAVYLDGENARLGLDLSGDSLHRRGYRDRAVQAPIKENLAAALLLRSRWPAVAARQGSLLDPMCGSGTLLIEGALIAADSAPGLYRDYFGFTGWKQHQPELWRRLLAEARQRRRAGLANMPAVIGFDQDSGAIAAALQNIARAGLAGKIHIERRVIDEARPLPGTGPGLVICNPPYGQRLGDERQVDALYRRFGDVLKSRFQGWQAALIIQDAESGFRFGIRSKKPVTFYNGALECKLLRLTVDEQAFFTPKAKTGPEPAARLKESAPPAEMFANRIRKNLQRLNPWAERNGISCYRVYDADLPEYAVAVDLYQGDGAWLNVQEYEPPKSVDPDKARQRLAAVLAELPALFDLDPDRIYLKVRRRQKDAEQYEKLGERGHFHVIEEHGCKLRVNFEDYLDTGLFLDHRPLRLLIQKQARDKHFLNLFGYTGSATVHAAVGGALSTTTVDLSRTYVEWAKKNLALNQTRGRHHFFQTDCREWLHDQIGRSLPPSYDLILLDPPTFSNSKRMPDIFDVQADHAALIRQCLALLAPGGVLYFSTNYRRFKFDYPALAEFTVADISAGTVPDDFARNPKIHYCWRISR